MSRPSKGMLLTVPWELQVGAGCVPRDFALSLAVTVSRNKTELLEWEPASMNRDSFKIPSLWFIMNVSFVFPVNNFLTWLFPFQKPPWSHSMQILIVLQWPIFPGTRVKVPTVGINLWATIQYCYYYYWVRLLLALVPCPLNTAIVG